MHNSLWMEKDGFALRFPRQKRVEIRDEKTTKYVYMCCNRPAGTQFLHAEKSPFFIPLMHLYTVFTDLVLNSHWPVVFLPPHSLGKKVFCVYVLKHSHSDAYIFLH